MKLKTNKTLSKRLRLSKSKKLIRRKAGQDHFNARETGKTARNKRRDLTIAKSFDRNLRRALPYS